MDCMTNITIIILNAFYIFLFLQGIFGAWFCRPEDTFHLASRKFMEREVFRSYYCSHILFSGVIGKCYVMNVKEYPKFKPMVNLLLLLD